MVLDTGTVQEAGEGSRDQEEALEGHGRRVSGVGPCSASRWERERPLAHGWIRGRVRQGHRPEQLTILKLKSLIYNPDEHRTFINYSLWKGDMGRTLYDV